MPSKRKPQPSAPSAEEMLRWLQRNKMQTARCEVFPRNRPWLVESYDGTSAWFGPTLRDAIRAAMRAEKEGRRARGHRGRHRCGTRYGCKATKVKVSRG